MLSLHVALVLSQERSRIAQLQKRERDERCFDVALKIVLAQALSSNGYEQVQVLKRLALLARSRGGVQRTGQDSRGGSVVVGTFPFSEEVVNYLETARSKCIQMLEQEMRTKLSAEYKQYLHLRSAGQSKWLPEQLHYSSLASYTNFKECRGFFKMR